MTAVVITIFYVFGYDTVQGRDSNPAPSLKQADADVCYAAVANKTLVYLLAIMKYLLMCILNTYNKAYIVMKKVPHDVIKKGIKVTKKVSEHFK